MCSISMHQSMDQTGFYILTYPTCLWWGGLFLQTVVRVHTNSVQKQKDKENRSISACCWGDEIWTVKQIISWPKHTSVNKGLSENHAASSEAKPTINWSWWDPPHLASAQMKKVGTNSNSLLLTFQLGVRPWKRGIGGTIRKTGFEEQTLP